MSGVTAIRQRKQWTADLTTLTDGIAVWGPGTGTPSGTGIAWASVINISGNTAPGFGGLGQAQWTVEWSDTQQPRYSNLEAVFNLTFTVSGMASGNWNVFIQQLGPFVSAEANGTGGSLSATIDINLTPSARPTLYSIGFGLSGGDTVATGVSGTITLTWS